MEFRILGPLEVHSGRGRVPLGGAKPASLLLALLLEPNRGVSHDHLIEAVWADRLPNTALAALHTYVSRLRRVLAEAEPGTPERIVTQPNGYLLRVESGELDLERFRKHVERAQVAAAAGRFGEAINDTEAGLGLWRGTALSAMSGGLRHQLAGLDEEYLAAVEQRIELKLAIGTADGLIGQLNSLITAHPLRERLREHLMLTLYRSGRQSDALAVYHDVHRLLDNELGIRPGPGIRELHQRILTGDPTLWTPFGALATRAGTGRVPRELPLGVPAFTGRDACLAELDALLAQEPEHAGRTVVIEGIAGIGKTALALHWAHRVASRLPDGQLYVNLRGHAQSPPMLATEALARFLRALGVPPEKVPREQDEQSAMYRSLTAERHMLVVLDNVATAEQVRPLLPGSPTCVVLITSRGNLSGLVVVEGARRLALAALTPEEANTLFERTLGDRARTETAAVAELARLSGYLPLAMRIAATHLAANPDQTIADYLGQLRSGDRPAPFDIHDDIDPADTFDETTNGAVRIDATAPTFVHRTPSQLPADIGDFLGRAEELATARSALTTPSGASVPVLVISGMPGVGKSAFAIKVAHEMRTRFPDGQLFIDLHGYSEHTPLSPARVLSRILPALGLPSSQVPTDPHDLISTYRSLIADRRVLLVLDNAASAQQVHDLIPAAPESAVLITSRSQMPSLAAVTGARLLPLAPLSPGESEQLVRTILSTTQKPADADIEQIIELCGQLPLAIRVAVTAYLHSARPLPEFVSELVQRDRLSALTIADDPRATVRAVFDLSYRTLSPAARRMFRLLSLVPGLDFCHSCARHVAGVSPAEAELLLGELRAASLVHAGRPRHYRFHDLVRLYAHDRCVSEDDPHELQAALARLHRYYVTTADQAADALYPTWVRLPRTIVASEHSPDVPDAAQWMGDEAPNLIATIRYTAEYGPVEIAWYLSESLRPYVVNRPEYRIEALGAFEIALRAAESAQDRRAMAVMHSAFGSVYIRVRDIPRALPHLRAELNQYLELGFPEGEARARVGLGDALATQGYLQDAADQIAEGLRIAEQHDFTALQLWALSNVSELEERRDQLDIAKKYILLAFDLIDATSSSSMKGTLHAILGMIMIRRGEFDEAIEQHLMALDYYRQSGDQHLESQALRGLAQAYSKTSDIKASTTHATRALAVAEELGDEYDITDSLISLAGIYQTLGLTAQARSHVGSALTMCERLEYRKAHIEALLELASIDRSEGLLDRAEEHAHHAIELARQEQLQRLQGDAEILLAWITHEKGDNNEALRHAGNAFEIHQKVSSPYGRIRSAHIKGLVLLALGHREQAKLEWTTSLEFFQGPAPEIDTIRTAVAEMS